jgi:hypothetical protein
MAQIVTEFASFSPRRIVGVLDELVQPQTVTRASSRSEPLRSELQAPGLLPLLPGLIRRELSSATVHSKGGIRYGAIFCPGFNRGQTSFWMGTIELKSPDWRPTWDALLKTSELLVVCVGMEEGIELSTDISITSESFPWTDRQLMIGATKGPNDTWDIREGPAIGYGRPPSPLR